MSDEIPISSVSFESCHGDSRLASKLYSLYDWGFELGLSNSGLSNSGQMLYTRVIKCADTEKSVSDTNLNWKLLVTFWPNAPVETSQKVFQLQLEYSREPRSELRSQSYLVIILEGAMNGSSIVEFRGLMFHAVSDSRHSCVMMFFVEWVRNKSTEELGSSWDSKTSSFNSWDVFNSYGICWNAGENVWKYVIKCL